MPGYILFFLFGFLVIVLVIALIKTIRTKSIDKCNGIMISHGPRMDYYVDWNRGKDWWPGTIDRPFQTFDRALAATNGINNYFQYLLMKRSDIKNF